MKNLDGFRAKIFRALSDPIRLKILECLRSGEKCVCDIVLRVRIAQPMVSRHLAILKGCGLVTYRREGNKRIYSVTNPAVFRLIDMVNKSLADSLTKRIIKQMV